ncbi:MAG: pantetheine-phosphate adenylyltransferase [Halothiobacillaceae bacterium]|nr:MAG: pantetheine-phosphate adenylyltransferase [Halothiobacillaceae bacterium]
MPMPVAIYPGTFDPITHGHIDVIRRAASLFDAIVVGVAGSSTKAPVFSLEERTAMARESLAGISGVRVEPFTGLLVDFAHAVGARVVVRGLRAVSDFEYEMQLASINRRLDASLETVFLTPAENYSFLASTLVREIARLGGDASPFVPPNVVAALKAKFG